MASAAFSPIRTERLLLRPARARDIDALVERRNDPRVARYQDWTLPYSRERAEQTFAVLLTMDGPANDAWWALTIADHDDQVVYGDLALHLSNRMRTAEIGYTLAAEAWGSGYATEAAAAISEHLFDVVGVSRVSAMLHPDNLASASVAERIGMVFEGHTRLSYWVGDDNSDDWHYGMTRESWEAWRSRPTTPARSVRLVEVTPDNVRAVQRLSTHKSQERLVSPVQVSLADAMVPEIVDGAPVVPWMRAIEEDGELAGFVMLAVTTDAHPEPYLWRLLIDRRHQRRGIGRLALDHVVAECRAMGDASLLTSWVDGHGSPRAFYERYGFKATGEIIDDEIEARLSFGV